VFEFFLAGSVHDCKRIMCKWDIECLGFLQASLMSRYDFPEAEVPSSTKTKRCNCRVRAQISELITVEADALLSTLIAI